MFFTILKLVLVILNCIFNLHFIELFHNSKLFTFQFHSYNSRCISIQISLDYQTFQLDVDYFALITFIIQTSTLLFNRILHVSMKFSTTAWKLQIRDAMQMQLVLKLICKYLVLIYQYSFKPFHSYIKPK